MQAPQECTSHVEVLHVMHAHMHVRVWVPLDGGTHLRWGRVCLHARLRRFLYKRGQLNLLLLWESLHRHPRQHRQVRRRVPGSRRPRCWQSLCRGRVLRAGTRVEDNVAILVCRRILRCSALLLHLLNLLLLLRLRVGRGVRVSHLHLHIAVLVLVLFPEAVVSTGSAFCNQHSRPTAPCWHVAPTATQWRRRINLAANDPRVQHHRHCRNSWAAELQEGDERGGQRVSPPRVGRRSP